MKKILVIGAGKIGWCHIQSLLKMDDQIEVFIVDTCKETLNYIKNELIKEEEKKKNKIIFLDNLNRLKQTVDLAIISTTADERAKVTRELLKKLNIKYIIFEKVLFQKIEDYDEILNLVQKNNIKAWVNCPRRVYPIYNELRKYFSGIRKITFTIKGGRWGLACNSIHFIDLVAFLCGNIKYKLNLKGLDEEIIQSKRKKFIEFTGKIKVDFENEISLIMKSFKWSNKSTVIKIKSRDLKIIIDEKMGRGNIITTNVTKRRKEIIFKVPLQSELTYKIVKDIFKKGKCNLTSFEESCSLHKPLIKELICHINKNSLKNENYIQIT